MKRLIIFPLWLVMIAAFMTATASTARQPVFEETILIDNAENIIAVDNVCAWPNLTLMPDGTIIATIFNKPSHGLKEGEADCYGSVDGGRTWRYLGTPIQHEPGTIRMNLAAGLSNDGSLVVLISGWGGLNFREYILPIAVCRSKDGGKTWIRKGAVMLPDGEPELIPYGDIVRLGGSTLAISAYGAVGGKYRPAYILYSHDDGYKWKDAAPLGKYNPNGIPYNDFNETALLRLRPDWWIAASDTDTNRDLQFSVSRDEGKTWNMPAELAGGAISKRLEQPAHLLLLKDGRILLTHGIRWGVHGVGARISDDEGRTWSAPMVPIYYGGRDGGYPSSVQLTDGTIVTAYYCDANKNHPRYHMGVVRWRIP